MIREAGNKIFEHSFDVHTHTCTFAPLKFPACIIENHLCLLSSFYQGKFLLDMFLNDEIIILERFCEFQIFVGVEPKRFDSALSLK